MEKAEQILKDKLRHLATNAELLNISKTQEYKACLEAMEEYANSKIPKWIPGKPDMEHTCLMMVKVYNNDKFLWDEYIAGRIDETGSVVFMNDDSTGWEQDAIECWMEIPKGAADIEDNIPKIKD